MKNIFLSVFCLVILVFSLSNYTNSQTIEQRLVVVQNDGIIGGSFRVQIHVKGTSLPVANTLGSATIDVQFNNSHLSYVNGTLFAFGGAQGYSRSATNNGTYIRFGVTGGAVNENGGGDPPGFDIGSSYTSLVQLNFTILNAAVTTSLTINNGTNAIGLFENHSNEPLTGVINNQTLTAPENITNVALPVELTSFTSKLMNDKIQLNWVTKTEINNFGFEIQRSTDGVNFSKIGFVEGNGNSNSQHNYSYTDAPKTASNYSYRLKQIDYDGKFEYSKVIEVEFAVKPTEYSLFQNYPNPFNPSTVIKYQLPKDNFVSLKVFNAIGQEVANLVNEVKPTGVYEVNFDASNQSSGIYYYILRIGGGSSNEFVRTNKMILLK